MKSDLAALRDFYHLHTLTRRRQGIPVQPWGFFTSLKRNIIDQGLGFLLLAYSGDSCIAATLYLHWGKTLTYKFGASNSIGQKLRANHFLFWTAIRWGCENGFEILDFGRSANSNQGLKDFKARWGADEVPLSYSFLPSGPQNDSSQKYMAIANVLIRNSPVWVSRILGKVLYKHFG
jgi:lipid II:glycine glycyltransferase (peptidoglycan interpeptide bridge formation enzyme)